MKEKLKLTKDWVHNAYDSRFIKVFGLEYVAGKQYMNATRRDVDEIEIINPLLFSTPGMTDESNALVCVVISDEQRLHLSQEGAEGTESFDGFVTLTKDEAKRILKQGKDDRGIFYSVYTWAALMHFVSGMWK